MAKKIVVSDSHRINELSLTPGGAVVTVVYKNGERRIYDKIKNVESYTNRITKDDSIVEVWCENAIVWKKPTH